MQPTRKLGDLSGIGKAMLEDFALLKIRTVDDLAATDPQKLYDDLCQRTKSKQDPCVLDTFRCAVAQARDPQLPAAHRPPDAAPPHRETANSPPSGESVVRGLSNAQRNWWYWSRLRKAGKL